MQRHSGEIQFVTEIIDDGTPYLVDNPLIEIPDSIRQFNVSNLSRLLCSDEDSLKEFNSVFGMTGKESCVTIYTMIRENGSYLIPIIVGYSGRFMNGDVGPDIGYSHGAAFMLSNPKDWPEKMGDILDYLSDRYAGEVAIEVDEDWKMSKLQFGHQPQYVSLMSEFYGMRYDELLGWLVNDDEAPRHSEGVVLSVMVSKPPFPVVEVPQGDQMQAANDAEKHIWRVIIGRCEVVFVSAYADNLPNCRRRVFRTINRMLKYDNRIQYRTDGGYKLDFGRMSEVYERYSKDSKRSDSK